MSLICYTVFHCDIVTTHQKDINSSLVILICHYASLILLKTEDAHFSKIGSDVEIKCHQSKCRQSIPF